MLKKKLLKSLILSCKFLKQVKNFIKYQKNKEMAFRFCLYV